MRYFYAIVTCNKRSTSAAIYEEFNGFEFELTSLKLTLSFVADEQTFPQKVKEECTEVPAGYTFDPTRVSRALNHSTVKLSWDQTDPRRQSRLQKNYKKVTSSDARHHMRDSEEDEAYDGLLATNSEESNTESDEDSDADNEEAK